MGPAPFAMIIDNEVEMAAWIRDTVERVVATYVEVLIGLLIVADSIDISAAKAAAIAALPAALTVLKAAIATRFGREDTAGFVDV